jgi:hypothetical protein
VSIAAKINRLFTFRRITSIFVVTTVIVIIVYALSALFSDDEMYYDRVFDAGFLQFFAFAMIFVLALPFLVGARLIAYTLDATTKLVLIGRFIVTGVCVYSIVLAGTVVLAYLKGYPFHRILSSHGDKILNMSLIFLACVLFPLLIIPSIATSGAITLATVEFVVRRIAENPKGPIFALSGMLAALAAMVKVFVSA